VNAYRLSFKGGESEATTEHRAFFPQALLELAKHSAVSTPLVKIVCIEEAFQATNESDAAHGNSRMKKRFTKSTLPDALHVAGRLPGEKNGRATGMKSKLALSVAKAIYGEKRSSRIDAASYGVSWAEGSSLRLLRSGRAAINPAVEDTTASACRLL